MSRNLRDNLHTILRTLVSKHIAIDTFANMPIHHGLFIIGRSCHMTTSLLDDMTQILHQRLCFELRHNLTT